MMDSTVESQPAAGAARDHLERGYRFEQAGSVSRALRAYRDALEAS